MWVLAAVCSAFFAGITAVLSKIGIKNTSSNVATAIRTCVVLAFSLLIATITNSFENIGEISVKSWAFLILSGLATGASWLCCFKALSLGEVSKVVAVDKLSVVFSVLFAMLIFANERNAWQIKLGCLTLIAIGTFLMTDVKKTEDKKSVKWFVFALLSAIFAAVTSLLAKIGIQNVNSNLATSIRTFVVLITAWLIVIGKKELKSVKEVTKKDLLFLVLSGIATGASWLCYYYAIQQGQISVVVPIDKTSVLITVVFSLIVFKEKLPKKSYLGLGLLLAGTILMAVLT